MLSNPDGGTGSVFGVFPVIPAAEIVQECKQGNDPGVCPGFFSQAEAILSDPYPMAHAVDAVPVKGVGVAYHRC